MMVFVPVKIYMHAYLIEYAKQIVMLMLMSLAMLLTEKDSILGQKIIICATNC